MKNRIKIQMEPSLDLGSSLDPRSAVDLLWQRDLRLA